ncbi:MAG: signal peptidase II [Phycisphaeraceae bacterium]|nr:signal peptidase II [Phycisphaeraceae bacterium]
MGSQTTDSTRNSITCPQAVASRRLQHLLFWPLALFGVALDLWTKHEAFARIDPTHGLDLIKGFLSFNLAYNTGAAFSMASGKTVFLCSISGVALVAVLAVFLFRKDWTVLMTVVLGLFAGGIAGNLYDRLFNDGTVRDFIDVYIGSHHWPTFNVADSLLCIAVGVLLVSSFITDRQSRSAHDPPQK